MRRGKKEEDKKNEGAEKVKERRRGKQEDGCCDVSDTATVLHHAPPLYTSSSVSFHLFTVPPTPWTLEFLFSLPPFFPSTEVFSTFQGSSGSPSSPPPPLNHCSFTLASARHSSKPNFFHLLSTSFPLPDTGFRFILASNFRASESISNAALLIEV